MHGTAYFPVGLDGSQLTTVGDHVIDVDGTTVNVRRAAPGPGPSGASRYTSGWWAVSETRATTLDAGGALASPADASVAWSVQAKVQVGSPARDWETLTITDTAAGGSHLDCTKVGTASTKLRLRLTFGAAGSGPGALAVQSCRPSTRVVTIDRHRPTRRRTA